MYAELLGYIAACCTTIAFVPQVMKTYRSKSAEGLSLGMFLLFTSGIILWLIYGIMINEYPIIIANLVTLVLATILIYFKLRYKNQ